MRRRRVGLFVAIAVTVLALGLAAPVLPTLSNDSGPASEAAGTGQQQGPILSVPEMPTWVVGVVFALLGVGTLFAAVLVAREEGLTPFAAIAVLGLFAVLFLVVTDFIDLGPLPQETREFLNASYSGVGERAGASGTAEDGAGSQGTPAAPVGSLGLLGIALAVGGVVVYRVTRGQGDEPPSSSIADQETEAAVGRAAGRAADRIEDTSLSNAVYEAWHEMTTVLDVADSETTTPAEFSAAAVAAGVDPADAEALTDLFREIRYGEAPVTPEREREARETFRRIEAAYTDRTEGRNS